MLPLVSAAPTLAVSIIFALWNAWLRHRRRRENVLRQRVAYLLWVAAHHE